MTHPTEQRLRADARRNRDQIVAAARTAFVATGPDVPMEEIARRAGVGVGTLYRRFPDREALVRAVVRETFVAVLHDARTALAEEPTAWDAFIRLVTRSPGVRLTVRLAVRSGRSWPAVGDDPEAVRLRADCLALLDGIVHAAQAEGALRSDVDTGDVATLLALLFRGEPGEPGDGSDTVDPRSVGLVLDGLRAGPARPLPGRPVTVTDLDRPAEARPGDAGPSEVRSTGTRPAEARPPGPLSGSVPDAGRSSRWSGWAPPTARSARSPR